LNPLIPEVLGVPEENFIWLRNAGNIIFDTMSSMMRTLALGCAIKGGREIALIGHTDCLVGKATTMQITDRFRELGVNRSQLPENLNEFFGLFASERQNVIRGTSIIRQSPLIGPRVPVHGLVIDIQTGKLEWLVNGYQTLETVVSSAAPNPVPAASPTIQPVETRSPKIPEFNVAELKLPEIKIGDVTVDPNQWLSKLTAIGSTIESKLESTMEALSPQARPAESVQAIQGGPSEAERKFDRASRYKVIGADEKVYGPINGLKILEWIADGRIGWETASQLEGSTEWRPLRAWGEMPKVPLPPPLKPEPLLRRFRKR
jgi:carbonic anhydrase